MSNITSLQIGQNKIEIEGRKVYTNTPISTSLSLGQNTLSLANYLPDDGYVYEVDFVYVFASDNDVVDVGFMTDVEYPHYVSLSHGKNMDDRGQIILNVGTDRYIKVNMTSTGAVPRTRALYAEGYKRLYKED